MGRPRKYATNAERQSAYRDRRKSSVLIEAVDTPKPKIIVRSDVEQLAKTTKQACSAYTPHGTKCKFCGKTH